MATTSIWKVEKRLDRVIVYVSNKEKTENKELYKSLHNAIEYVKADFKTEKQLYVTAINCDEDTVLEDMIRTKKRFGKINGILGYHAFQSFKENEVTPKQAHEIGVKLAQELWGDKYEVIVTTHLNTNHLHNHFLLNSVSFIDGKKYRNTRENYAIMRRTSDDLCREYNLSVIDEKPCGKHNIDYTKYYTSYIQKSDYYINAKKDIDRAINQSYSYKEFEKSLKNFGYEITIRANKISIRKPPYKRNIRIERAFGIEYSIKNIEDRILTREIPRLKLTRVNNKKKYFNDKYKNLKELNKERGSLYRLYLYYCYLLNKIPKKKRQVKKITNRNGKSKMQIISEEIKFISRNKIKTINELFSYKKNAIDELNEKMKKRASIRWTLRKVEDVQERQKLYEEISNLSNSINKLKKEVVYCQNIEESTKQMINNLKEIEQKQKEKEEQKEQEKQEKLRKNSKYIL